MKIPLIRQILVVVSSVALVSVVMIRFDDILNVAITPLPPAAKECLQARLTNDVSAQATCSVSAENALSAWTSDGKLRETNIFEDWTTGKVTLTGTEGIRLENTATKYGFINSEAALHVSQNTYYNGTAWKRITTGRTGGFQTNTISSEALRVFSDDSNVANTVDPSNTPRFIVRTDGDIIVNGTTGFGDARMSFNNTSGNNDSTIVMRGGPNNNGPVYSLMPWDSQVYLGAGVYYSNGAWVHASPTATSQLFTMQPGTGVRWYTSNNSSVSWNVAPGTVLWNESGQWTSSVTGSLTGPIASTSKGTITTAGNDMAVGNNSNIELRSDDPDGAGPLPVGAPYISFHRPGLYGAHFGLDTDNWFSTKGWSPGANAYANMRVGQLNAKGRIYPENWIEFAEYEGLYSPLNSAHFYPNDLSYGSWRVRGSRNNWYGLEFDTNAGQTSLMMGNTGNVWGNQQIGAHNNSYGWLWYFSHQNLYTSAVYDIASPGYYMDPASTSVLRAVTVTNGSGPPIRLLPGGTNNGATFDIQSIGDGGGGTDVYFDINNYGNFFRWRFGSAGGMLQRMYLGSGGQLWIASTITQNSDARLKEQVAPLEGSLAKVLALNGVSYRWKEDARNISDRKSVGFIAQDVEKVMPEVVSEDEDGYKSVQYQNIVSYVVEAVKELHASLESFRKDVLARLDRMGSRQAEQEELIRAQQATIENLEQRIRKLEAAGDEN
jgi:hypothetical protein